LACSGGGDSAADGATTQATAASNAAASALDDALCMTPAAPADRSITALRRSRSLPWSNPDAWPSRRVPQAGELVTIPAGMQMELDTHTPKLGGLVIEGRLVARDAADVSITADSIKITGAGAELRAGADGQPYSGSFNIRLSGTNPNIDVQGHGTKLVMTQNGGRLALFGQRKRPFSRLAATVLAGASQITLVDEPTGWRVGDQVAVAPTDFQALEAEKRSVVAINGRTLSLDAPLAFAHWGAAAEVHGGLVLDMRAHVANLSRNIRISSIENEERLLPGFDPQSVDANGQQNGRGLRPALGRFGGHMAFMRGSFAQLDAVEITGMGQQGMLARYPVHWHLAGDESAQGNFMRFSSLHGSFQRGVVIHQSNGIEVEDNVLFDILGHAVYFEDGIEHDNVVDRNLVMLVRYVPRQHRLSLKDREKDRAEKLSGFWVTNPANYLRDNIVSGVQNGWGFIFANVEEDKIPVIAPSDVNWAGNRSYVGFDRNVAYAIGFMPGVPDGGDSVFNLGYGPEEAGSCFRFNFPGDYSRSRNSTGLVAFKCANAAFWSTNFLPIQSSVVADSRTAIVNNQGEDGVSQLQNSAVVGMTANNKPGRVDLDFGPFTGPSFKEHLEAGPVSLDNVVTAYKLKESFEGLSPAMDTAPNAAAGFQLRLPAYVAIKANSTALMSVGVSASEASRYGGRVTLSLQIPKPPNLADENPYYPLTADALTVKPGTSGNTMTLRHGAAQRPGNSVVVVKATGDATVLSTVNVLTATVPQVHTNAATGHNLSRLIAADSPRNPRMSSVVQNAGGRFAVDGDMGTWARFEGTPAPWIQLDFGRSYTLKKVIIEWEPSGVPVGDLLLTLSEFDLLDGKTLAAVQALPSEVATTIPVRNTGANRIEVMLPAGTVVRLGKLWTTQDQGREVRLRELRFESQ
jgi:G8 domain